MISGRVLSSGGAILLTALLIVVAAVVLVPVEQWDVVGMVIMAILPVFLVVALVALALAAVSYRLGRRLPAGLLAVVITCTAVVISVPLVSQWRTADAYGVRLSLWDALFSQLNLGEPDLSRSVTYAMPDGRELRLDVWEAPRAGDEPRPAVVWVHGGSWSGGTRGAAPKWNKWFNDRGYTVFDIEYRLSPQPNWQAAPADVACALGWVKAHAADYQVDPSRVILAGRSAGAHLALHVGYAVAADAPFQPSCPLGDPTVAAVVALYGPTDLVRAWRVSSPRWKRPLENYLGGTPDEVADRYRRSSPVHDVRLGLPPTLLAHGERDTIVSHEQMTLLAAALERVDAPHTAVSLPYALHAFDVAWGNVNTQITRHVLDRFLAEHVPVEGR
ncbi:MAG: alpha/beta hydrolase fold domain-containing protein [Haloechinothrix sp.]